MRRFVILGHTQKTTAPLPLNDPAGAGGRWDLLARCVTTGLLVSHGIRDDAEVVLVLTAGPAPRCVRAVGSEIRSLNPDERSAVALLSRALEATDVGAHESTPLPGLHVARRTIEDVLAAAARAGPVVLLSETAPVAFEEWSPPPGDATFVLGDHRDPTPVELAAVGRVGAAEVTLGPVALQADQCVAVVHNRLDRLRASPTRAFARP